MDNKTFSVYLRWCRKTANREFHSIETGAAKEFSKIWQNLRTVSKTSNSHA
jgi:hypothetical protein